MLNRNSNENKSDLNVIYGIHAVEELIINRLNEIESIYFDIDKRKGRTFELLKKTRKKKISCQCVPYEKLNGIARSKHHQGVVALCAVKPYDSMKDVLKLINASSKPPVILVPASLQDSGNLGAIIRTSVAFNVTAILLEKKGSAPLNAGAAKASAGMLEYIPVVKEPNLEKNLIDLKEKGFSVIGAESRIAKNPEEIDFRKPVVIITGGEHRGIPPYLKRLCTEFTHIPMKDNVESLNVSVAASILLYECARQRGF